MTEIDLTVSRRMREAESNILDLQHAVIQAETKEAKRTEEFYGSQWGPMQRNVNTASVLSWVAASVAMFTLLLAVAIAVYLGVTTG